MNCPECAVEVTAADRECPLCGSGLPQTAAPAPSACSSCGRRIGPTDAFCAHCGMRVDRMPPSPDGRDASADPVLSLSEHLQAGTAHARAPRRRHAVALLVMAMIALVVAGSMALRSLADRNEPTQGAEGGLIPTASPAPSQTEDAAPEPSDLRADIGNRGVFLEGRHPDRDDIAAVPSRGGRGVRPIRREWRIHTTARLQRHDGHDLRHGLHTAVRREGHLRRRPQRTNPPLGNRAHLIGGVNPGRGQHRVPPASSIHRCGQRPTAPGLAIP